MWSGSGSGSGNSSLGFMNCPQAAVHLNGVMDPNVVQLPTGFTFTMLEDGSAPAETGVTLDGSSLPLAFFNVTRDENGQIILLLPGPTFSVANNFIQINLTVAGVDMMNINVESCRITVEIMLFEASLCVNPHPPLLRILVTLSSVTLILDVQRDLVRLFITVKPVSIL